MTMGAIDNDLPDAEIIAVMRLCQSLKDCIKRLGKHWYPRASEILLLKACLRRFEEVLDAESTDEQRSIILDAFNQGFFVLAEQDDKIRATLKKAKP